MVWVLWNNIGSELYGIFSTKEKAIEAAKSQYVDDDLEYDAADWSYMEVPLDKIHLL